MRRGLREAGRSRPLIFKPADGSECNGILLSRPQTFDTALENALHSATERFVIQDLVLDNLLYRGRKFDLRVYVLVHSFEPLRYRTLREGVARIAAEPLTHSTIAEPVCALTGNSYRLRLGYPAENLLITDVLSYLQNEGLNVSDFWPLVDLLIGKVLSAFAEYVVQAKERNLRRRFYFAGMDVLMSPLGKGFELLFIETNYVPQLTEWGHISLAPVHHCLLEQLYKRLTAGGSSSS